MIWSFQELTRIAGAGAAVMLLIIVAIGLLFWWGHWD